MFGKYRFFIPYNLKFTCHRFVVSLPLMFLSCAITLVFLTSCTSQNVVEEHFKSHGMTYPLDTSDISAWNLKRVNIDENELLAPGAMEYIESGILFVKKYFQQQDFKTFIPGAQALALSKPVLFRDKSGEVGLMIRTVYYGAGKPSSKITLPVEHLGTDTQLWRVENFAYFSRDYDYQTWKFNGWVF
jgi:hypothetical protein